MGRSLLFVPFVVVTACADGNLNTAENSVQRALPDSEFVQIADYAAALSRAYVDAARNTSTLQDVQSILIFLSAGVFVKGLVDDASDTALADAAIAGAAMQQIGKRTAPKSSIVGMYVGAKRLNCISTVTRVGSYSLSSQSQNTQLAARALAYGAVEEVRITTRESIVREIADYDQLVKDILPPGVQVPAAAIEGGVDESKLKAFSGELAKCLAKKADSAS